MADSSKLERRSVPSHRDTDSVTPVPNVNTGHAQLPPQSEHITALGRFWREALKLILRSFSFLLLAVALTSNEKAEAVA